MKPTLYGAEWCPACNQAKKYLTDRKIDFKYIAVDSDEGMTMAKSKNINSIPVLEVGNDKIVGYSLDKYNALFSHS